MRNRLDSVCVFFLCYKDIGGTDAALRCFRKFYPKATVHLICDGGLDQSEIAKRYSCIYYHESHIGLQIRVGKESMHEWVRRFQRTCAECKEDWVLVMEEDVYVRRPIHRPRFMIEGMEFGHKLYARPIGRYIFARHPHLVNNGYGGGGGSLVNRKTALEAIRLYFEREDFDQWKKMARYVASDIWLTTMFMAAGYQYGPCADLVQTYFTPEWPTTSHAIVHARVPVNRLLSMIRRCRRQQREHALDEPAKGL